MADVDHDFSAQLKEPHAESAEGNLTDSHSEDAEQHEAPAPDADGPPSDELLANGAKEDQLADVMIEAKATLPEEGVDATPIKDAAPASPAKPKAKSSISIKPTGPGGGAPGTPTVRKVRSFRHANRTHELIGACVR